jgi:hypothetical protein
MAFRTLNSRKKLYDLICQGNISEAIEYCEDVFPNVLASQSDQVNFALRCQQFIECVKQSTSEALIFAQNGSFFFI